MVGLTYRVNIYPGSQKNIQIIVPCARVCEIAHFAKMFLVQMYANLGNLWRPVPEVTSNDRKFVALIQVFWIYKQNAQMLMFEGFPLS